MTLDILVNIGSGNDWLVPKPESVLTYCQLELKEKLVQWNCNLKF